MGRTPKFDYRAVLERELQGQAEGITLDELLERSGFAADRTTLFRHLSRLIQEGKVERVGKARASRYRPLAAASGNAPLPPQAIPLTRPEAASSAGLIERYQPDLTPYLQQADLALLRNAGMVEASAGAPGTYAAWVYNLLEPDLCHASARLAGCGYSAAETEALLEHGAILPDRDPSEAVVILNHREALHQVVDALSETDLTGQQLLRLHATLSKNLLSGIMEAQTGAATGDKDILPALADVQAIENFAAKLLQIKDPFEQAFCALLFLSVTTAFANGDRGTSRLAANIPLLKHDLCPLSFIGVDQAEWDAAIAAAVKSADAAPLKQLFVDAYLRSAERYQQAAVPAEVIPPPMPDYGPAIKKAVRTIVRDWKRCNRVNLEIYLSLLVGKEHLQTVAKIVERELAGLHQGNLADFGLTPAEFACFTPPVALASSADA